MVDKVSHHPAGDIAGGRHPRRHGFWTWGARVGLLPLAMGVLLFGGCGSGEPPKEPAAKKEVPDVPHAQMRKIVEGLRSKHPRMQYAALDTLSRFPAVAEIHRGQIEQLETGARDPAVRKKAAAVLSALEEGEP